MKTFKLTAIVIPFLCASMICLDAKIIVQSPDSLTLTTRKGLVLELSNQLDGLPNNDAVAYVVLKGKNKSRETVRLAPDDFVLKDETGTVVKGISGKEALKTVVDWNYEKARDYIRIGDADLRDVLRISNEPTAAKALTEINLSPQQEVNQRALFFPKLPKGKFTLEFGPDKVEIQVEDGVYFVRPETTKADTKGSK